jgi:CRP-like cAMP-binding protein
MLVLTLLSHRFRDADRKRIEFGASDATARVAARIAELAESHGERSDRGLEIMLPLSQAELAGLSGCSREAAAKALRTFRDLGWVETHRRHITVLDLDPLRRRASH